MDSRYQTVWQRFAAQIIDGVVFAVFAWVTMMVSFMLLSRSAADILEIIALVFLVFVGLFVASHVYVIVCVAIWGQTMGKMAAGVVVVNARTGGPAGLGRAILRDLGMLGTQALWVVSIIFLVEWDLGEYAGFAQAAIGWGWTLLVIVTMLSNARRRAVHDYIAGTVVVKKAFRGVPFVDSPAYTAPAPMAAEYGVK